MSNKQRNHHEPDGSTDRARSAASGLYRRVATEKKPKSVSGRFGLGPRTVVAGHGGIRKPEPVTEAESGKPYSPPSFLGMFELPADSSERVKAVVRDQDEV
ncbi:hypothetical protein [Amycolatopsis magusensis]|uniref:Uncharacterized protein n=1 Tax=Amycolatopsis magusensis TaxID=882444 RepID=A0ABS4PQ54_9PSEU|nr:hypothetical protein [Amycolatopsis magusensis]MBP2181545.1 hypothetical protein [Amycolatopsis magusensis]